MPQFDHTGPEGMGPRTGRGMGKCGGNARKGAQNGAAAPAAGAAKPAAGAAAAKPAAGAKPAAAAPANVSSTA